ncbi:hypothetical protein TAMA11512_21480 [Selenomonas sp. TAMA-11512]|uniref:hypothetical protein n=1 Tax=Selenomonas sp. TAMA-11512 TaxID=3095337 RepID=UPI00308A0260|nr:hypothetical protein TAMA11512_21480 [Selenomonas sp. TAMA-11512]
MRNDSHINELCKKWKEILKLNEWDIRVDLGRPDELSEQDREGECFIELAKGEAHICLLDPKIPYNFTFPYDIEKVLVHELLHLSFAFFEPKDDPLRHDLWERLIEQSAKTLVRLQRSIDET